MQTYLYGLNYSLVIQIIYKAEEKTKHTKGVILRSVGLCAYVCVCVWRWKTGIRKIKNKIRHLKYQHNFVDLWTMNTFLYNIEVINEISNRINFVQKISEDSGVQEWESNGDRLIDS